MAFVKQWMARLALAFVATLVTLEIGLALLALVGIGRARPSERPDADVVVLCVGDSHTYGAPLPAEQSYPSQLEVRLRERYPERSFAVVNLGIPGANTSMVLARLPGWLDRYQPDVLMFWAGVNNAWNVAETPDDAGIESLLFRSRVYRLVTRLWFDRVGPSDARPGLLSHDRAGSRWRVGGRLAETRRGSPEAAAWQARLRSDLEALVALSRARGVPLSLLTYPVLSKQLSPVNEIVDEVGRAHNVMTANGPFNLVHARRDGHHDDELIVLAAGPHPTGLLYRYVVDALMHHMAFHLAAIDKGASVSPKSPAPASKRSAAGP